MGQKTHPVGFRLGIVKQWKSRWFATKDMPALLKEDELIRKYLKARLGHAAIAEVHRALSAQDAGSELTRVNGLAHRGAQPISEAFRAVPAAPSTWRSARAARSTRRSGA